MPYSVDESQWPLAVLCIQGAVTPAEEVEFSELTREFAGRAVPYAIIIDARTSDTPSPRFMRLQARAQERCEDGIRTYCEGMAFIITSPMIRGALRAILHLNSLPCRRVVVASMEEARAWTAEQLAKSA